MPAGNHFETSQRRYQKFVAASVPKRLSASASSGSTGVGRAQVKRYLSWLQPHRGQLAFVGLLSLANLGLDMVWPLVSAHLVDEVILNDGLAKEEKAQALLYSAAFMLVVFGLSAIAGLARNLQLTALSAKVSFAMRRRLFHRVLRLPLKELSQLKAGGILSCLSTDVDATSTLLQQALVIPTMAGLRLLVTLGILFSLDPYITAGVALALPPLMALQAARSRRVRPIWRSLSQDRQEIAGRVGEGVTGIRVVRSFGREKREEQAYLTGHHTVIRKQLLAARIQRAISTLWELSVPFSHLGVLCLGGYFVVQGATTLGIVVAFQAYLTRLFQPIVQIATSISGTQRGLASMDRVFELLDKPEELAGAEGTRQAPQEIEEISFEGVTFGYREDKPVIMDFNLRVPGGSVVALVGPSGAGKSTLTDLVARFEDPTKGRLCLNGIDLKEFNAKSYRRLLGLVSQEVFLFDGTVHENIAYARPEASSDEVIRAAMGASAHTFISEMPDGYQTLIGERGVKLSGGQRQRLSIARALLADPAILILDEATSNLDTESERLIQDSLERLLQGRTTFVIAHRLSTIEYADQIVVLEGGRAVEIGTHRDLMARKGRYYAMVRGQQQREQAASQLLI